MKSKLFAVLLILLLAVTGCSSGSNTNTPDGKLATIDKMMAKGYVMSDNQRQTINQMVADGKKLVAEGKTTEANKLLEL